MLLQNCAPVDAYTVAEDRNAVIEFAFVWDGANTASAPASAGGVPRLPLPWRLIELADSLCYLAKDSGRNRVGSMAGVAPVVLGPDVSHRPGAPGTTTRLLAASTGPWGMTPLNLREPAGFAGPIAPVLGVAQANNR